MARLLQRTEIDQRESEGTGDPKDNEDSEDDEESGGSRAQDDDEEA
jgi:hypothetical protein